MRNDVDDDSPPSHAIADRWANFSETVSPGIGGSAHAEAHIAFYFAAMYVRKS